MKKIVLAFSVLVLSATVPQAVFSQTDIGGTIYNNTTLTATNSPYIVTDNITVNAGVTLTIESGTELQFKAGKHIVVYGTLDANGATFTANNRTSEGFWDGLNAGYEYGSDQGHISLNNCHVEYAASLRAKMGTITLTGNTLLENFSSNGVDIYTNGTLDMEQTTIRNCTWPVYFRGSGSWTTGDGLSLTGNDHDYVYINFRDIIHDLVCRDVGIPYYFDSELRITEGSLLHLYPGVKFLGSNNAWISVNGKLKATGTSADSVVFDHEPGSSYWRGINFNDHAVDTACLLSYCRFSGANYSYYNDRSSEIHNCAVEVIHCSPSFDHCTFSDNRYNLVISGISSPVFTQCTFGPSTNVSEQTLNINMDPNASPVFTGCSIAFNNQEGRAIGLTGSVIIHDAHLKALSFNGIDNITYTLEDDIVIHDTASFVIDSGLVIKFRDNSCTLTANGPLTGSGTASYPIVFTYINDDNFGNPPDTHNDGTSTISPGSSGKIILNSPETSRLEYCKLLYGGKSSYDYFITLTHSNILKNCEIRKSYRAVLFKDDAQVLNNQFYDIDYYPLTRDLNAGSPVLIGNTVQDVGNIGIYIRSFLSGTYSFGGLGFAGYDNVAYIIDNSLTIPDEADVTVLPGTVIKFRPYNGKLIVNGGLKASGESANRIIFTSLFDNSVSGNTNFNSGEDPVNRKWIGIVFSSGSHDNFNTLENCEIRYVTQGIEINNCKVTMQTVNLNFSDNYGLKIFGNANPVISGCTFNNIGRSPVYMDMFAQPVFSGNTVANVGRMGLSIRGGTISGTVPVRSFAGYDTITYLIDENLRVDDELIIPAGLVFKSANGNYFNIYGKLTVEGTASHPVVFTTLQDDDYGNPKDTEQNSSSTIYNRGCRIIFNPQTDDNSAISYAVFRYSSHQPVYMTNASPSISHTLFYRSQNSAIALLGTSAPSIDNCTFQDVPYPLTLSLLAFPSSESNNILTGTTARGLHIVDNETLTQQATLSPRNFAGITNIPYIFNRYTVGTSGVLTIEPGVVCKFRQNGYLYVRNGLIADGGNTPDSTIVFTADRDDFYGGDTYNDGNAATAHNHWWYGIFFAGESIDASCRLDNCVIKNASRHYSSYQNNNNRGGITIDNASPTITHCLFEEDYWAMLIRNTSVPVINNCDFTKCDQNGYAIWNETGTVTVTAEDCWWNDDTGPYHPTLNPDGKGERVSDNVDFTPWITHPSKPVMGDVSLNGTVMPYDASLVLQHTVGNITLTTRQQAVADVSYDGTISSWDASLILQYTVGLISSFDQGKKKSVLAGGNITVEAPAGPLTPETSVFNVPLTITTSKDIKALDMTIATNSDHLRFTGLETGDLPADILTATGFDTITGEIHISLASAYDLNLNRKEFQLTFEVKPDKREESVISLTRLAGNEKEEAGPFFTLAVNTGGTATGILNSSLRNIRIYSHGALVITDMDLLSVQPEITIDVFDLSGRKTNHLIFRNVAAGRSHLTFRPVQKTDQYGTGIYIIRICGKDFSLTRKILLHGWE